MLREVVQAALALAVALLPAASAGTAEDPEIRDPLGDAQATSGAPAPVVGDLVDFDAVWVDAEDGRHLTLAMHVADLELLRSLLADPLFYQSMAVDFDLGALDTGCEGPDFSARATLYGGISAPTPVSLPPSVRFAIGRLDSVCEFEFETTSGELDFARDVVTFRVERDALGLPPAGTAIVFATADAWNQAAVAGAADVWSAVDSGPARGYLLTLDSTQPPVPVHDQDPDAELAAANEAPGPGLTWAVLLLAAAALVAARRMR